MTFSSEQVWEAFSEQLYQFIRRRVNDPEDANDILQDVFLKIHTRIDTLKEETRLTSWLYQLTRNTIIDHYRVRRPFVEISEIFTVEQDNPQIEPAAQLAAGLRDFVDCLPEKYRQAVILAELDGIKQAEVADRLGISLSGAKSRVQRGREKLRQALLDCCHFEFDRRGHLQEFIPRQQCCSQCTSPGRA
jgi:RNA polymerase sigma-70 factor, ECF subfamily